MENRQVPLRTRRVCRFCLAESEPLSYIYDQNFSKPYQVPLPLQIMSIVSIEVYAADGMPQMVCTMCRWNLERSYKFKQQCKKADEALRNYPMSGMLPRPFPPLSTEPPERPLLKRSQDQNSQNEPKKSRLDNGDQRRDNKDKERQKSDREQLYEEEAEVGSEAEVEAGNDKVDMKLEPGEIRVPVHACEQCDKTFALRQSLVVHVMRIHRDRNHKCPECDRMFLSKHDLTKHMVIHAEEKPFSCPICSKQFTRANLLQRHEKVHRDELRYGCQHCEREFFTNEELEKHEEMAHSSKSVKPYQCNLCNKQFTYKQGLERHELLHNEDKTFVCEYCKEAFRTSTKLAKHLTTHAGHRPYLCKLCPRSFLLSHHLTRHMRTHSVEKRHVCEDCGKAFKRKESLDVHQLTHVKRSGPDLTCDVCQESCRNRADYVTHIKQHIEAGEKRGPDGIPPESKDKMEMEDTEEEEDEEEEDQYSDDDYHPPSYVAKTLPKIKRSVSDEDVDDPGEEPAQKEQVVFVRNKDGNVVKKTIKTLMPMPKREVKGASSREEGKHDDTEAQVQKLVTSIFKEHKISLKNQPEGKEAAAAAAPKAPKVEILSQSSQSGPSMRSAVKVAKKIYVQTLGDSGSSVTTLTSTAPAPKEVLSETPAAAAAAAAATPVATAPAPAPAPKPKRFIVRKIIRDGDTVREVVMNPDGTLVDPAELEKMSKKNILKRVIVKRPLDKTQSPVAVQALLQSVMNQPAVATSKPADKFELKTVQQQQQQQQQQQPSTSQTQKDEDKETKEKLERLERLEKVVEQHDLKIGELEARNLPEPDLMDDMLPERHDESDEEQKLPLPRVFVKTSGSIYDEEKQYNDDDKAEEAVTVTVAAAAAVVEKESEKAVSEDEVVAPPKRDANSKVYGNKKAQQKAEESAPEPPVQEPPPVQDVDMSQELCNILESTEDVVKMQENALNNLAEITSLPEGSKKWFEEKVKEEVPKEQDEVEMEVLEEPKDGEGAESAGNGENSVASESAEATAQEAPEAKDEPMEVSQDKEQLPLNDAVLEDSRDSIEDKLSQMEG